MKRRNVFVAVCVAVTLMAFSIQGLWAQRHEVVEKVAARGRINWSQGIIYAKGMGAAPDRSSQKDEKAVVEAYSNLLETIKGARIDSSTVVRDLVEKSETVRSQVEEMAKRAQIVKREYLSDGMVEVTLAFKLTAGFAQLVLPGDIMPVPQIKTIPRTPPKEQDPEQGAERSTPTPETAAYTGLVLDARGLKGRPAMSPRIVDEYGQEVYGSVYVSREFAVQHGMAGYERDLKGARNSPRVSDNPLTVRALRTVGPGRCDFVVSNVDAWKIRSTSENLLFLKKCRVIIVLD